MAAAAAKKVDSLRLLPLCRHHRQYHHHPAFFRTETPLQLSIRTAIETNNHHHIPQLLQSSHHNPETETEPEPFALLFAIPPPLTVRLVDGILQSFILLRPRSLPHPAYASLLSLSLPHPTNPSTPSPLLPLALAVLQTSIRSGFSPPLVTRLSLSLSWLQLRHRHHRQPISRILSSMRQIGYPPDVSTCNYLISSLCSVSELEEAIGVLRGMSAAGCLPDSESYCSVIDTSCGIGEVAVAEELLREMVAVEGMVPRKGTVLRLTAAMRKEGHVKRAAEVVRFLEVEGFPVGFEGYQAVVEGCVKREEFVLAGKVVVEMAKRGFIPYLKVRQRVVEGLVRIGRPELAAAVRQGLAEIKS